MASDEVYLNLQSRMQADHVMISLKDMASVVADVETPWAQQAIFNIGNLSQPNRLSRVEIEDLLLKQYSWLRGKIVWGGASSILIEGRKHAQSLDAGVAQAQQWLEQTMEGQTGRKSEYRLVNKMSLLELPAGKVSQQPMVERVRFIGHRAEMPLYIFVDQRLIAKRNLQFELRPPSGGRELESLLTDKDNGKLSVPTDKELVANNEIPVVPAGSKLLISKNQLVKVLMQHGPIQIESEGRAQSDAESGTSVMVQRLDSPDMFMAQVLQPGIVTVKE